MTDIRVEPPDEPGRTPGAAESVTFGRVGGRAGGRGLAGWLRDQPRLRALRRRPPYSVVAVVAAVVGGTAVAVYMDRPVEIVASSPTVLDLNPAPESWLNVIVDDTTPMVPFAEEMEQMLARHPADATVTRPLELYAENLLALPPGTYRVAASCSAETIPPSDRPSPAWFTVDILDPSTYEPAPESSSGRDPAELVCDGDPHTLATGMTVADYQALAASYYTAFHEQAEEGPDGPGVAVPGVYVAVSFTPVR
jgi:hypothetical protein